MRHLLSLFLIWIMLVPVFGQNISPTRYSLLFHQLSEEVQLSYPHFAARKFDWNSHQAQFHKQAARLENSDQLYDLLRTLLLPMNDPRVSLTIPGSPNYTFQASEASEFQNRFHTSKLVTAWKLATKKTLHHEGFEINLSINGQDRKQVLSYATSGRFGFLKIQSFGHLAKAKQGEAIQRLVNELTKKEGLILDLRNTKGYDDQFAYQLASRLTDHRVIGHYRQTVTKGVPGTMVPWLLNPAGLAGLFRGPVVVLTNEETQGSAEVLALALSQLSHVTLIGTPGRGALSEVETHQLANGWEFTLPAYRVFSPDKQSFESTGVPVDIFVKELPTEVEKGQDVPLKKALVALRVNSIPEEVSVLPEN
ncbi:MAG: S41 family peptidase [Bacteroidota bacterium]